MDVHNMCLVVAVLSLSVSGVVVWLAFVRSGVDSQSSRQERHVRALVRAIQSSQTQNSSDHELSMLVASPDSPWRGLDVTLGNYFTHGYFNHKGEYHQEYTHSPLTILPFFHDEGGEFERCLRKTALAHNQAVAPEMTLGNRLKWDTSSEGLFKFKHKFKLHYGKASFMACDWGQMGSDGGVQPGSAGCGHAFIMQDPFMLAISDLGKCLLEPQDQPLCQQLLQNKISVEEWVAARGSVVFKHILFDSEICQNGDSQPEAQLHQPKPHHLSGGQLCQKNHDSYIDSLQPETVNQLINFITRNIHKLFSVVGIFEDFGKSLALLNRVFRLPLNECEFLSRFSKTSTTERPKYVHTMKLNSADETSPNKIRFDLVDKLSYKDIASLLRFNIEDEDGYTLLHAFRHIENSMTWSLETVDTSNSNSSISEGHERLDVMYDYDILDVNTSDSSDVPDVNTGDSRDVPDVNTGDSHDEPDVNTGDSHDEPDVNTSDSDDIPDVNISDSRDFPGVNTNVDVIDSYSSMDTIRNTDSNTTPKSDVLYFNKETAGRQLDDIGVKDNEDEDDDQHEAGDEDEDDDSQKNLQSDNTLFHQALLRQARKLQEDAVRTRLYNLFQDNERISKILSPDMRIYKAVKRLYSQQKRLFFNSVKTV